MGGWGAAGGTSPGRAGRRGRWGMSLSLVFLAGWWSACARHDSGDVTRSAPTGGAEGSGGDAPVEPSEPPVEASCPSTEPVPSSACDRAGMRCSYGASSEDFLCTRDGRWKRRTFVPGEGGGPAILTDQPELVDCSELDIAECASHPQCSSVLAEVGMFCDPASCAWIPVADCPAERCQVIPDCAGEPRCSTLPEPLPEPLPCASVGMQRDVRCCVGLVETCGIPTSEILVGLQTNECKPHGLHGFDFPVCRACGDGTCEDGENHCNCPEDCEVPE